MARFTVIELVVADMARSLAFYRHLGVAAPDGVDDQPHVEAELGGGIRMAWDTEDTIRSFDTAWTRPTSGRSMALAFECDNANDVDATHGALIAAGYESHLDPFDAVWGMRYAAVLDPDGNTVDLFAALG